MKYLFLIMAVVLSSFSVAEQRQFTNPTAIITQGSPTTGFQQLAAWQANCEHGSYTKSFSNILAGEMFVITDDTNRIADYMYASGTQVMASLGCKKAPYNSWSLTVDGAGMLVSNSLNGLVTLTAADISGYTYIGYDCSDNLEGGMGKSKAGSTAEFLVDTDYSCSGSAVVRISTNRTNDLYSNYALPAANFTWVLVDSYPDGGPEYVAPMAAVSFSVGAAPQPQPPTVAE